MPAGIRDLWSQLQKKTTRRFSSS